MNRRPQLALVAPGASPAEAAAVTAAVEQFLRDRAPVVEPPAAGPSPWLVASLHEGVARQPGPAPNWI